MPDIGVRQSDSGGVDFLEEFSQLEDELFFAGFFEICPGFGQEVEQAAAVDLFGDEKGVLFETAAGFDAVTNGVIGFDVIFKQEIGVSPFHFGL